MQVEIPDLHLPVQTLKSGEYLYREGEDANRLFVVLDGRVVISKGPNDATIIDFVAGPAFAGQTVLTGSPSYETSARAYHSACTIQEIDKENLEGLLECSSQLEHSLLLSETLRAKRLERRSIAQHNGPAASVAQVLLDLADVNPTPDRISHIPQKYIGNMAGVTRETTNKYLGRLYAYDIIKRARLQPSTLYIPERRRLVDIAENRKQVFLKAS